MPVLFAVQSAEDLFFELLVAGVLGHGLCRTTLRMKEVQPRLLQISAWLGGLTGLVCAVQPQLASGSSQEFSLVAAAMVGFFSGILATCGWYLVVAVLVFVWLHILTVPFRWLARIRAARQVRHSQRNSAKLSEQQREQQILARREEERARQTTDGRQRDEQKRRDDARFACQMHYDRLSADIGNQFPAGRLQEYFERYLSDSQNAAEVEDRAGKLRDMLDELGGSRSGRKRIGASLVTIRLEYQIRREEIHAAGFDQETAAALLASLAREEEQAIREFGQT